jgi:hypothetical protein
MEKAPDEPVELVAKDELPSEENAMREFAANLEAEAAKLDNYVGTEPRPDLRVEAEIRSKLTILGQIVRYFLLQLLHLFRTFQQA